MLEQSAILLNRLSALTVCFHRNSYPKTAAHFSGIALEPDTRRVVRINQSLCGDKGNECQYNNAGFRESLSKMGLAAQLG